MQFAIDMDAGKAWVGINNTWVNSGNPSTGANAIVTSGLTGDITPAFSDSDAAGHDLVANFGQDSSFAGAKTAQGNGGDGEDFYYTPPTGYKALNTDNLDDPAIALPGDYFNTVIYTGNNASPRSITGVGFEPGLVWIKDRDASYNHVWNDIVRGVGVSGTPKTIYSDSTGAEGAQNTGHVSAFNSDGFSIADGSAGNERDSTNNSGEKYVSWNWKAGGTASSNTDGNITSSVSANTTAGFSVVGYTGTGVASSASSGRVGHGLSVAPELIIIKSRDDTYNWVIGSNYLTSWHYILRLNDTSAEISSSGDRFNGSGPNAGFFNLGTSTETNESGKDYIAYCLHSVEGYSKIGAVHRSRDTRRIYLYRVQTRFSSGEVLFQCRE